MLSLNSTPLTFESAEGTFVGVSVASLRVAGVAEAVILVGVKAHLRAAIDARAEAIRSALITPGSGQALEYLQCQNQAAAALKAPSTATAARYPMLAASIGIDLDPQTGTAAVDVLGVARSVDAALQLWLEYGAAIRAVRLAAKTAIDAATTVEAAADTFAAIPWPAP